jgi:hypothetical protein
MALTETTDLSPKVQAHYDKRFLLTAKPNLAYYQLGQKKGLPKGVGKTIYFSRYMPLPVNTTPLEESRNGGRTEGRTINTTEMSVIVQEYGDYAEISEIASLTSLDVGVKEKVEILGNQAALTIETLIREEVGVGFMRRRADGNSTYQKDKVATKTAEDTTTIIDSSITEDANFWVGAYVTFTDPTFKNYGLTRRVTASTKGTGTVDGTLTLAEPLPVKVGEGNSYRLTLGKGIAPTGVLTTKAISLAVKDLKTMKAMPLSDGSYVCVIDPSLEYDFRADDKWVNAATYKESVKYLYTGEIGRWNNVRFVVASEVYRETEVGTFSATGPVRVATLLGRETFGVVELEGDAKKIYVRTSEQLAQPIPMTSTVGWKVGFATKVLNGTFGVNILCGATN